jgi:hypothetical protein
MVTKIDFSMGRDSLNWLVRCPALQISVINGKIISKVPM